MPKSSSFVFSLTNPLYTKIGAQFYPQSNTKIPLSSPLLKEYATELEVFVSTLLPDEDPGKVDLFSVKSEKGGCQRIYGPLVVREGDNAVISIGGKNAKIPDGIEVDFMTRSNGEYLDYFMIMAVKSGENRFKFQTPMFMALEKGESVDPFDLREAWSDNELSKYLKELLVFAPTLPLSLLLPGAYPVIGGNTFKTKNGRLAGTLQIGDIQGQRLSLDRQEKVDLAKGDSFWCPSKDLPMLESFGISEDNQVTLVITSVIEKDGKFRVESSLIAISYEAYMDRMASVA